MASHVLADGADSAALSLPATQCACLEPHPIACDCSCPECEARHNAIDAMFPVGWLTCNQCNNAFHPDLQRCQQQCGCPCLLPLKKCVQCGKWLRAEIDGIPTANVCGIHFIASVAMYDESDVELVFQQAGVTRDVATAALRRSRGDVVAAIIALTMEAPPEQFPVGFMREEFISMDAGPMPVCAVCGELGAHSGRLCPDRPGARSEEWWERVNALEEPFPGRGLTCGECSSTFHPDLDRCEKPCGCPCILHLANYHASFLSARAVFEDAPGRPER